MIESVWVFNGANANFSSGIFLDKSVADNWIKKNNLTGILTLYPLNKGVYDWAIEQGFFSPHTDAHFSPIFIQKFTSASQEHYHYVDGLLDN
ncbi:DUF7710 domain-containing protein [Flavisolibacter ginsenosidimutans]|uniref:DUF7710 domain-containing protein n=1 Tax=Flavisolibacter ginsenosidimutans TaxID=661481 RepID=A0A5B8UNQ8_9BACT|nr:hypothetical protein [Flavisolibacter ginsenosidimutans]QEC58284.1 hypothetical protein FSB75_21025 [Flavisolibacter ginsenosidimutans]